MAKASINTKKNSKLSPNIQVEGLAELVNGLVQAGRETDVRNSFALALAEEASVVFARSQMLVPVDTGLLRSSGYVSPVQSDGKTSYVEISYGGPASAYAMIVHEGFARHAEPTQRKYLEQPLYERAPTFSRNIGVRMKDILLRIPRG
jgi:hypothetical protein